MKSVYIHIPFCKSICSYCDFCKMFYHPKWAHDYLIKLKEEIEDFYLGDEIKTIYIGGGTPSCLSLKEIEYLLKLTTIFVKKETIEFTFECNMEDINEELLILLKQYGVNRLSIGIQSFQEQNLRLLGRKHTWESAMEKMNLIRKLGFYNINLDFIYAIPGETLKDVAQDLKMFLKLKPDHISTYSLIMEEHTILSWKHMQPIDEEKDAQMYHLICKVLEKNKFKHYEVSNFAKEKKESIHNLTYWNNEEYYGFGLSASGYIDQLRYTNTKNLTSYLNGQKNGTQELLSKRDIMDNEIMLGLRKRVGVNKEEFQRKYEIPMEEAYPIKPLVRNGDLKEKNGYVFIPKEKIYVMNEILLKMI